MRVIAGEFKGRKLNSVPGVQTRPTSDKVKESVFNMIGPYFDGGASLDLYAGSGGLSIEAVSRGIEKAILVDKKTPAIKTIKMNTALTNQENKFDVRKDIATNALEKLGQEATVFSLVFLDPPYLKAEPFILQDIIALLDYNLLEDNALIICETDRKTDLPQKINDVALWKQEKYGSTKIWIYRNENGE